MKPLEVNFDNQKKATVNNETTAEIKTSNKEAEKKETERKETQREKTQREETKRKETEKKEFDEKNNTEKNKKVNIEDKKNESVKEENTSKRNILGWLDLVFLVGIILVFLLYGRNYTNKIFSSNPVLINQLVLYFLPFLYAIIRKAKIKDLYSIKFFNVVDMLAGLSVIIGVMCLDTCLEYFLAKYFNIVSNTTTTTRSIGMGFGMAVLSLAVFPAICEEFFYRGYVFGILKNKANMLVAIIFSAIVFGVFHFNLAQGISAFMTGLFLAYVVGSTQSIFVVIFMHFINNFVFIYMVYYPKQFSYLPIISKKVCNLSDVLYLVVSSLFFIVPGIVLCKVRRNKLKN